MDPHGTAEDQFRDFLPYAEDSATFVAWTRGVLDDAEVRAWIDRLPAAKRQPNLVFAAARWHGVPAPGPYAGLRAALLADEQAGGAIAATIRARATQTNEVGLLATLLPTFAEVAEREDRPLALLEVGASAGLCLYPDQWAYRWQHDDGSATSLGSAAVALECEVEGAVRLPTQLPEVAWRGGLDVHPLDVADDDAASWLETLVWPEHEERRTRLRAAVSMARAEPPSIRRGDLLADLDPLVDEAAEHGTVVVFHSAVLSYLDVEGRTRFDAAMRERVAAGRCHWISNEGCAVLPDVTAGLPAELAGEQAHREFVLGLDGVGVARTHGHGRRLRGPAAD